MRKRERERERKEDDERKKKILARSRSLSPPEVSKPKEKTKLLSLSLSLTKGVSSGPVLEHLVRLKPLRDARGTGLGRDSGEQDARDGGHRDAAVDELRVREPFEDLRVGAQAERVEAVVSRERAIEVGRRGVS